MLSVSVEYCMNQFYCQFSSKFLFVPFWGIRLNIYRLYNLTVTHNGVFQPVSINKKENGIRCTVYLLYFFPNKVPDSEIMIKVIVP